MRLRRNRPEADRQNREWQQQNGSVNGDLLSDIRDAREQMRIDVTEQKHELKKKNAGSPDIRSAAKVRKKHFANHGLAHEKKEGAQKKRGRDDAYSQIKSLLQIGNSKISDCLY